MKYWWQVQNELNENPTNKDRKSIEIVRVWVCMFKFVWVESENAEERINQSASIGPGIPSVKLPKIDNAMPILARTAQSNPIQSNILFYLKKYTDTVVQTQY